MPRFRQRQIYEQSLAETYSHLKGSRLVDIAPRRTPRQERAVCTVESVLEAAAHILDETGLAGLNTNAVARRAGVSIGSLYQYFPNKEAITTALILRSHEEIVTGLRRILAETEGLPPDRAISAMLRMLIDAQPTAPRVQRVLEAEELRLPKTEAILAAEQEIEALNAAFFARYIDPRRCSDAALRVAARDTVCIVRSLMDSAVDTDALDAPDLLGRLQRAVEGYLAPLLQINCSPQDA